MDISALNKSYVASFLLLLSISNVAADPPKRELDLAKQLGSMENPVQTCGPAGQHEYLMRLRCAAGEAPKFSRSGSMGRGPYGGIVDGYRVECKDSEALIVMDMYRCKGREMQAVTGFTILDELPARIARGCPPAVPGELIGQYAFHSLEVEKSAKRPLEIEKPPRLGEGGRVYFSMVVSEGGTPDPATIEVKYLKNESMRQSAISFAKTLKFVPAIHHDDCAVRQRTEFGIDFPHQE